MRQETSEKNNGNILPQEPIVNHSDTSCKYDKRGILSFATVLLFIFSFVMIAIGLIMLSGTHDYLPAICLIAGLVHLLAGSFMLIPLSKTPYLQQEKKEQVKKPTTIFKGILLSVEIFLCFLPFLVIAFQSSLQVNKYASNLQGDVFGNLVNEDLYISYTFEDKRTCVRREYDISGYLPIVTAEENLRYSVSGNSEKPILKLGQLSCKTDLFGGAISSFYEYDESYHKLKESEIPIADYRDFVTNYNAAVLGPNSLTSPSDSDYITSAQDVLIQQDVIKFPETVIWYRSTVYEKDRYGRAIVHLDFSCETTFGVAKRYERYVFIQSVEGSKYSFNPLYFHCESKLLDMYKTMNSFNVHPNQDQYEKILIEETLRTVGNVTVTETLSFSQYTCSSELLTIDLYADLESSNLSAIKITVNTGKFSELDTDSQNLVTRAVWCATLQMDSAQSAQLINTCPVQFNSAEASKYLSATNQICNFVKGGMIIRGGTENGKSVISIIDGFRYGFTEGNYWIPGAQTENSTNIVDNSDSFNNTDVPNIETDPTIASDSASNSATSTFHIDYSKSLSMEWTDSYGETYQAHYAFEANGACYMILSAGLEVISKGNGYFNISGNNITFQMCIDGMDKTYTYRYNADTKTFTQASNNGLAYGHNKGDTYSITIGGSVSIEKIKELTKNASGVTGNQNPDSTGNNTSDSNPSCSHTFADATCTRPKTCTKCGITSGYSTDHTWEKTSCTTPDACRYCGEIKMGTATGHVWNNASCTQPQTCASCGETQGTLLPHNLQLTKCAYCDYTDYSVIAKSYSNVVAYDAKTGEDLTVTNVSISSSGVLTFTYEGTTYSVSIKQRSYAYDTYFNCYHNGSYVENAEFRVNDSSVGLVCHFEWSGLNGHNLYFFIKVAQ